MDSQMTRNFKRQLREMVDEMFCDIDDNGDIDETLSDIRDLLNEIEATYNDD